MPRSFFDRHRTAGGRTEVGIDHAYALTRYAVQGSTRAVSTSRIDATTTRAETYVDITRGRHANHLYLTATSDSTAKHSPGCQRPPPTKPSPTASNTPPEELTAWELLHPEDSSTPRLPPALGL